MAHNATNLSLNDFFNASPEDSGASFWNGRAGPASDEQGNIYVVSANVISTRISWQPYRTNPFSDSGGPRRVAAQLGIERTILIARMQRLGISHKALGPRAGLRTMPAATAGSW